MKSETLRYAASLLLLAGSLVTAFAKWLPTEDRSGIRLLDCKYDRQYLKERAPMSDSKRWRTERKETSRRLLIPSLADSVTVITTTYSFIAQEDMDESGVAVAHDFKCCFIISKALSAPFFSKKRNLLSKFCIFFGY